MGILEAIQVLPEWWLHYLFRTGVEGAIAAGLIWGVFRFGKRISPSVLYACALLVLLKCTVPAFLISVPVSGFRVVPSSTEVAILDDTVSPTLMAESNQSRDVEPVDSPPSLVLDSQTEREDFDPIQSPIVNPSSPFRYRDVLMGIYLLGLGIMVLRVGRSASHWGHIRQNSERVTDDTLLAGLHLTAQRFHLKTLPEIRITSACVSPVLHGAVRCTLLWPQSFPTLAETQEITLLHELAHWKRKDHWINAIRVWIQCIHWWNPVVWWINRKITLYQEMCCDDVVLQHETNCHSDYLKLLVYLAEHSIKQRRILNAVGLSQAFYTLQERMKRIMDQKSRPTIALSLVGKIALVSVAFLFFINFLPSESESQNSEISSEIQNPVTEKESVEPIPYPVYQLNYRFTYKTRANNQIILKQLEKQMQSQHPNSQLIHDLEQSLQEGLQKQYSFFVLLDFDSPDPVNFPTYPGHFLTNILPFTKDQIFKSEVSYLCNKWIIREDVDVPDIYTGIITYRAQNLPVRLENCLLINTLLKAYFLVNLANKNQEKELIHEVYFSNPKIPPPVNDVRPSPSIEESSSQYKMHFIRFQDIELTVEFTRLSNGNLILTRYFYVDNSSTYELKLDELKEREDLKPDDVWSWKIAELPTQQQEKTMKNL